MRNACQPPPALRDVINRIDDNREFGQVVQLNAKQFVRAHAQQIKTWLQQKAIENARGNRRR